MATILDYPNELPLTETDPVRIANLVRKGWVPRPDKPAYDPLTHQCVWNGTEWIIEVRPLFESSAPVPASVAAHLLRRALRGAGMYSAVQTYIDGLPADDPMREDWEYAPYFRRDAVGIASAAVALNLTSEQIDNLFRAAQASTQTV